MASRPATLTLVAVAALVLAASDATATHFRYGHASSVPLAGNTVHFTVQNAFRRNDTPSFNPCIDVATNGVIPCSGGDGFPTPGDVIREDIGDTRLDPGDGSTPIGGPGGRPLYYLVTSVDPSNNWLFGLALDPTDLPTLDTNIEHTYATAGPHTARVNDCCRISPTVAPNAHLNNPDLDYRIETQVTLGAANASPLTSLPPIVVCPLNALCEFLVPATDPDGDTLTFRLSTPLEADTGAFVQPGPPRAVNGATIDANSGVYRWNTTGATLGPVGFNTLYSTQVTIEERNGLGALKGKSAVDFLIQLVPLVDDPPDFTSDLQYQRPDPHRRAVHVRGVRDRLRCRRHRHPERRGPARRGHHDPGAPDGRQPRVERLRVDARHGPGRHVRRHLHRQRSGRPSGPVPGDAGGRQPVPGWRHRSRRGLRQRARRRRRLLLGHLRARPGRDHLQRRRRVRRPRHLSGRRVHAGRGWRRQRR
jgi:hypothetical protein